MIYDNNDNNYEKNVHLGLIRIIDDIIIAVTNIIIFFIMQNDKL